MTICESNLCFFLFFVALFGSREILSITNGANCSFSFDNFPPSKVKCLWTSVLYFPCFSFCSSSKQGVFKGLSFCRSFIKEKVLRQAMKCVLCCAETSPSAVVLLRHLDLQHLWCSSPWLPGVLCRLPFSSPSQLFTTGLLLYKYVALQKCKLGSRLPLCLPFVGFFSKQHNSFVFMRYVVWPELVSSRIWNCEVQFLTEQWSSLGQLLAVYLTYLSGLLWR